MATSDNDPILAADAQAGEGYDELSEDDAAAEFLGGTGIEMIVDPSTIIL